ncbi:MAG TPA: hypothetical protein VF089_13555, partial [Candidatus Binatia bacterium]
MLRYCADFFVLTRCVSSKPHHTGWTAGSHHLSASLGDHEGTVKKVAIPVGDFHMGNPGFSIKNIID